MSTIHATALLIGERALLVCGAAGSGKSALALALMREAEHSPSLCVRLIADDRTKIENVNGRLLACAPSPLAGLIEERSRGILNVPHEACGIIAAVLDLEKNPERLPEPEENFAEIAGLKIPRFLHAAQASLSLVKAAEIMKKAHDCNQL
jgi:HPr kinase/phosphorylase